MAQILNFKNDYVGLSQSEAEERLKMYGLNSAEAEEKLFSVVRLIFKPRSFLQIIAAALMFAAGEILAGIIMVLLTVLYFFTQIHLGKKLYEKTTNLKRLSGMKYRVVRDGGLTLVRKEYLVPDDILVLQGGERVPADAYLMETERLQMDESLFSGDKTPVCDKATEVDKNKQAPRKNCIYKDTIVLSGSLVAKIYATGEDASHYKEEKTEDGSFERAAKGVSFVMNIASVLMLGLALLLSFAGQFFRESLAETISCSLIPAVGFALCFVPTEISSLIRLYYVTCAERMNRRHALVKSRRVMENLSALTCLCVEKSGTITKDHLEVSGEYTENRPMFQNVSVLACDPSPQTALEQAVILNATFCGVDTKALHGNRLLAQYPFSEDSKLAGNLWEIGDARLLCIKGSPENILSLCDVDTDQLHFIQNKQHSFTTAGEQVLAFAYRMLSEDEEEPQSLLGASYTYIGLLAFASQTRDTVPYAVKCCYKAGVNVIMTTDDNEETALAIARKIGLKPGRAITGEQLSQYRLNGETPDLTDVNVFAKVTSSQRCEIVRMLQEQGEIVAMTGNGIDDIDVLEQADVGIVTNGTACPAATESSDLIMNDQNLIAAVDAIKESRQGHLNIKRCVGLVISAHFALGIFALINLLTGGLIISPALAALLSTAVIPACALMFLDNIADIKQDFIPSSFLARGKVGKVFLLRSLIQGGTLGLGAVLFYLMSMGLDDSVKCAAFFLMFNVGLLLCGISGISVKRTYFEAARERKSFFSLFISGIVVLVTLMLVYIPYLNSAFGMTMLNIFVMLIALLVTVVANGWPEIVKLIRRKQ